MMMTLYHYVHCPFCLRVRFALGFLNLDYQSRVLPYHDEETPLSLTGTKMLPILTVGDRAYNESQDIIDLIDKQKLLSTEFITSDLEEALNKLAAPIHNLCMPYWQYTPEFDNTSRLYFKNKKERKRGPFAQLIRNKETYLDQLTPLLEKLEEQLQPFYHSNTMTLADIYLASHLWGLYIFPEFQFSPTIHKYLQNIKEACHFDYHADYWREDD